MPGVNGYNVGRDVTVNINTANGVVRLNTIEMFDSKPNIEKKEVRGLDGIRHPLIFPDGWSGSFEVARQDASLDDFWATVETNYYAGQGIPSATITETITEIDGSVSQYKYINAILFLDDAGSWKGNDKVVQRLGFEAQQRVKQ